MMKSMKSTAFFYCCIVFLLMHTSRTSASAPARPNILLILSDDHSVPFLGCYGNPDMKTPNLDKMASEGALFRRAYTTAPQCIPSRAAILAGHYGEIQRLDYHIGLLIDELEERGQLDNTVIVFMGDNGAELFRGKGTLYERGLNVPLIVRFPEKLKPGVVYQELISGEDIAPMLLDFAGLPMWKELGQMASEGRLEEPWNSIYFSPERPMFALYDLEKDPDELKEALHEWMILNQDYLPLPVPPSYKRIER
jgi:arylsulfatase A-like enzyme